MTVDKVCRPLTQFAQNWRTSSGWLCATALLRSCRMAAYIGERAIGDVMNETQRGVQTNLRSGVAEAL